MTWGALEQSLLVVATRIRGARHELRTRNEVEFWTRHRPTTTGHPLGTGGDTVTIRTGDRTRDVGTVATRINREISLVVRVVPVVRLPHATLEDLVSATHAR